MEENTTAYKAYVVPSSVESEDAQENLNNIEKIIDDLNTRRDAGLDPALDERLKKQLLISQVFHSNAIEGSKLSLRETEIILDGMVVNERPLKDELEAQSLANATDYLYRLIDGREPLTKRTLLELHGLIMKNIPDFEGGKFRDGHTKIKNSDHIPPDPLYIDSMIDKMFQWMNRYSHKHRPLVMGAILHHWLTWIHPFTDGNGRIARLFLNFYLLQKGYPEVVIKLSDRDEYYDSLIKADNGDVTPLVELITDKIRQTVTIYEEFINENDRQKAWKLKYKEISVVQYEKAKETYSFQYEVWKNQISVFRTLLHENVSDISEYLPHLKLAIKDYDILSFSQYLDILEDRRVSNTWYISLYSYSDEEKYRTSFIFYFDRFRPTKPISIMGITAKDAKSGRPSRFISKPSIKLYVSARLNRRSQDLKNEIDLINVGTWGDQLSFGVLNREGIMRRRGDFPPRIRTIRENPGKIVRNFIDQILRYYYGVKLSKD